MNWLAASLGRTGFEGERVGKLGRGGRRMRESESLDKMSSLVRKFKRLMKGQNHKMRCISKKHDK
jgi:hypothetical protein